MWGLCAILLTPASVWRPRFHSIFTCKWPQVPWEHSEQVNVDGKMQLVPSASITGAALQMLLFRPAIYWRGISIHVSTNEIDMWHTQWSLTHLKKLENIHVDAKLLSNNIKRNNWEKKKYIYIKQKNSPLAVYIVLKFIIYYIPDLGTHRFYCILFASCGGCWHNVLPHWCIAHTCCSRLGIFLFFPWSFFEPSSPMPVPWPYPPPPALCYSVPGGQNDQCHAFAEIVYNLINNTEIQKHITYTNVCLCHLVQHLILK